MKASRHQKILQHIKQHETLTTADLAQLLEVSQETIRRDLNELQAQGLIIRQHGRAKSIKRATQSILLIDKSKMCRTGEVKIGTLDDVEQVISNVDAE